MVAVTCGLLLVLSSNAISGDGCGRECGPKCGPKTHSGACAGHPALALEKAGVTEEQKRLLVDLRSDQRLKAVDLKASVEKAMLELQRVLAQDDVKEEALHASIEKVGRTKVALRKHQATGLLKVREILGPVVWKKVCGLVIRHVFGPGHGHGLRAGCHGRCGGTECLCGRCGGHAGHAARCGGSCKSCENRRRTCGSDCEGRKNHPRKCEGSCEGCEHKRQGCGGGRGRPEPEGDD